MSGSTRSLITGVDDEVLRAAVGAARAHSAEGQTAHEGSEAAELFARAAWNYLVEPGDGVAGTLIAAVGAPAALELVIAEHDGAGGRGRARALGIDESHLGDRALSDALGRWLPRLNRAAVVRACGAAATAKSALLVPSDDAWPLALNDLGEHAPLALWWRGRLSSMLALGESISLVGSRACTDYGLNVTMEASAGLVDRGFAIVSGAAYGIDGMAHRAALASEGTTIAVLAGGLDRFYPSGHHELITRITETGVVFSEVSCGVSPTRWRFLQRNRLIAALGNATVVLEAGGRSGTFNTASHAATLGRPLGAVPGPVSSLTSAGCHRLLREFEAICVTTPGEMAELARPWTAAAGPAGGPDAVRDPSETRVLDALSARSARTPDELAVRAGMSAVTILGVLGSLSLDGSVRERSDGWVRQAR